MSFSRSRPMPPLTRREKTVWRPLRGSERPSLVCGRGVSLPAQPPRVLKSRGAAPTDRSAGEGSHGQGGASAREGAAQPPGLYSLIHGTKLKKPSNHAASSPI